MRVWCGLVVPAVILGAATLATSAASAQTPRCNAAHLENLPVIKPKIFSNMVFFERTQHGFACQMWQAFVYLNWPVSNRRGVPNASAKFGAPGPTVWESFKTVEQVYLPNAQDPGSWAKAVRLDKLNRRLARQVAAGRMRHLTMTSKVSTAVLENVQRHAALYPDIYDSISKIAGEKIYDQNGKPVLYEVAMDRVYYDYATKNSLYNANKQIEFARTAPIVLPDGAVTVKAAWKTLTPAEIKSGHFHTTQALSFDSTAPVTVGLVGLHIFQALTNTGQGAWATFAQIENAPVHGDTITGPYSFYDTHCNCPNGVNIPKNPTQIVQMNPDEMKSSETTKYMNGLITAYDKKSPWRFYKLVSVQWAEDPVDISRLMPPVDAPLPDGMATPKTAVNAVLETFKQDPKMHCLVCHTGATVASGDNTNPALASYYSFTFGHATWPK
jgi:hypothetical protein